jgi:hypothetical protein
MTNPSAELLTQSKDKEGKKASAKTFPISSIPDVMNRMGWKVAARVMRQWFDGEAFELSQQHKQGKLPASTLDKKNLITDIPFDWLFTASDRVKPKVDQFLSELAASTEFNSSIGKSKGLLDQLSNGLVVMMTRLRRLGLLDVKAGKLKDAFCDFGDKTAIELEELSQFNLIRVGSTTQEKALDALDDVYGAFGNFLVKVAATRFRTIVDDNGFQAIEIMELGFYGRDTYDFLNDDGDQLLGYWADEGVLRPNVYDYFVGKPAVIKNEGVDYCRITNDHFNEFRNKYKKGGDMISFTTVKLYETSFIVHLGPLDFEEYKFRSGSM